MASLKRKADGLNSQDPKKPKHDASITSFFGAPKVTSTAAKSGGNTTSNGFSAQPEPNINFDKDKWVASLNAEQKKLLKLEIDTLHPSWLSQLKDEVTSPEFLSLKRFLQQEVDSGKKIFPPAEEIYSWSRHSPLNTVKVVILGQDPYHNHNQAHGLCFSVRPPTPAPPSLKNIYTAIARDYPSFTPPAKNGGLLTPWADQGVLLLNTCLTVRAHEANSHSNKGWEKFTQKVIDTVVRVRTRGVVFLAWGSPAQKRCAKISGAKHLVLKSVHPSPLSASRGFFECGHFKKTNEWLKERYGVEGVIEWSLDGKKGVIKEPEVLGPVKVTEEQNVDEDGPVTELPEKASGEKLVREEEFEGEDDEDAIQALEELAKQEEAGGKTWRDGKTVITTKEEANMAVEGGEANQDQTAAEVAHQQQQNGEGKEDEKKILDQD